MPFAEINGIKYHYERFGSGEPIVLVTGLLGDVNFWYKTFPMLADKYDVIAVDNRGAGLTEYNGPFTTEDMGEDVAALVEHLGVGPVHILGWSMGSHIALSFASSHPELTRSLTLVSSYLKRPSRSAYILGMLAQQYRDGKVSEDAIGAVMNVLLRTEAFFKNAEEKGKPVRSMQINDPEGMIYQMMAVESFDIGKHAHLVKAPTLSVHGLEDIMTPASCGDEIADAIGGCRTLRVPGEGHIMRPETYIPAFLEFIKNI